jgi:hypothetical protein
MTQQTRKRASSRELRRNLAKAAQENWDLGRAAAQGREAMRLLSAVVRHFGSVLPVGEADNRARRVVLNAIQQDLPTTAVVTSEMDDETYTLTLTYYPSKPQETPDHDGPNGPDRADCRGADVDPAGSTGEDHD